MVILKIAQGCMGASSRKKVLGATVLGVPHNFMNFASREPPGSYNENPKRLPHSSDRGGKN